jgi:hypothetical protein
MTNYYFDTSALVKRYVPEVGSAWVAEIVGSGTPKQPLHNISIAKIGLVEVAAALSKRRRAGEISPEASRVLYARFLRDSAEHYRLIELTDELCHFAARLTQRTSVRSYDAVHLAAALALNKQLKLFHLPPMVFVSADRQLCQTAQAEGLPTEDPKSHP